MSNQTTHLKVRFGVAVPGVRTAQEVRELLESLVGEGQFACTEIANDPDRAEDHDEAKLAASMRFGGWRVEMECVDGPDCDVAVDVDEASYIGDGEDGVYYQVFEDSKGDYWWSSIVDCNTSGFCDGLTTGAGPYASYDEAEQHARDEGWDWCINAGVDVCEDGCPE